MRRTYAIVVALLVCAVQMSGQVWDWARGSGGSAELDAVRGLAADAEGNCYFTGYFKGTMSLGGFTLTSNGGTDIFLGRMNRDGSVAWLQGIGNQYDDYGYGVAMSADGHVVFVGKVVDTATFGGIQIKPRSDPAIPMM
jgi:hypothetical protein